MARKGRLTFPKLPLCAKCQPSIFRNVAFDLHSNPMRPGSTGVCLSDEARGTDTTRLDSVTAQNTLLVLLAAVCGLLHSLGLPQYWFLSGILPWMQQPGTAPFQSSYWLHPALVMESLISGHVLYLDALSSYTEAKH